MPKRKPPPVANEEEKTAGRIQATAAVAPAEGAASRVTGSIDPRINDVLFGRGDTINRHPGNKKFRELVDKHKRVYLASRFKQEKRMIADGILTAIGERDPPGRFLAKNSSTGLWHVVDHARAREKTLQALREKARSARDQMDNRDIVTQNSSESTADHSNREQPPPAAPSVPQQASLVASLDQDPYLRVAAALSQSQVQTVARTPPPFLHLSGVAPRSQAGSAMSSAQCARPKSESTETRPLAPPPCLPATLVTRTTTRTALPYQDLPPGSFPSEQLPAVAQRPTDQLAQPVAASTTMSIPSRQGRSSTTISPQAYAAPPDADAASQDPQSRHSQHASAASAEPVQGQPFPPRREHHPREHATVVPSTPRHAILNSNLGVSPMSAGTFEALQMIAFPESPNPGSSLFSSLQHPFSPRRLPPSAHQERQASGLQPTASSFDQGTSLAQIESPLRSETWPQRHQRRRLEPRPMQAFLTAQQQAALQVHAQQQQNLQLQQALPRQQQQLELGVMLNQAQAARLSQAQAGQLHNQHANLGLSLGLEERTQERSVHTGNGWPISTSATTATRSMDGSVAHDTAEPNSATAAGAGARSIPLPRAGLAPRATPHPSSGEDASPHLRRPS